MFKKKNVIKKETIETKTPLIFGIDIPEILPKCVVLSMDILKKEGKK
jgi:hypothetical protein